MKVLLEPVSYTHLDVYKRQLQDLPAGAVPVYGHYIQVFAYFSQRFFPGVYHYYVMPGFCQHLRDLKPGFPRPDDYDCQIATPFQSACILRLHDVSLLSVIFTVYL